MSKRLFMAAIVAISSALLSPVMAQQRPGPPGSVPTGNPRENASDIQGRSNEMERVRRDAAQPKPDPDPRFPEIKEDFERLQVINSGDLQAGASSEMLDYKKISNAAAEIKKRATRLKSNLFPAESEKQSKGKGQDTEDQQDLKSLLAALDRAITSFVTNPIFQNTRVVDPKDSTKARHDLETVIKLSTRIKKEADQLNKAGGG
jgi:hypothetical protein